MPAVAAPYRDRLNVILVETGADLRAALAEIESLRPRLLGLDVETLGLEVSDPVSLVQVALDEPERRIAPRQYLIDALALDLDPLRDMLERPGVYKLVQSGDFERERLQYQHGIALAPVVDTRREGEALQRVLTTLAPEQRRLLGVEWEIDPEARPERAFGANTLAALAERFLGAPLDKTERVSDWRQRPFDPDQIIYAALDAAILPPLMRAQRALGRQLGIEPQLIKMHRAFDQTVLAASARRLRFAPPPSDADAIAFLLARASSRPALAEAWRAARCARLSAVERAELRRSARECWQQVPLA